MEGRAAPHLKHIGIRCESWRRCRKASVAFYATCRCAVHDLQSNFDFALGEYINHCFAEDVPYHIALDAVAAVRGGSSHGYVVRQQQQKLNLRNWQRPTCHATAC